MPMPSIVLVNKTATVEFLNRISKIVTELGVGEEEGEITFSPIFTQGLDCVDMTKEHKGCSYIVVRHTNEGMAMRIARALKKKLKMNVQVEILRAFLSVENPDLNRT